MKGYELILLANGILFLAIGLLAYANADVIVRQGEECASGNATTCARDVATGRTIQRATPWLLGVSLVLFTIGFGLILRRRWRPAKPEGPDEGPGYP